MVTLWIADHLPSQALLLGFDFALFDLIVTFVEISLDGRKFGLTGAVVNNK